MLLRPTAEDLQVIVRVTGHALLLLGAATLVLAVVAVLQRDVNAASALAVGGALGAGAGIAARLRTSTRAPLTWTRGAVVMVLTAVLGSLVAAVPLYLSGHYGSYLDAVVEAVSGLTTTGLTLVQDLDHLSVTLRLYRHVLELAGGLAIVVVGLSVLAAPSVHASSLEPSDVRDERITPSLARVWRSVATIATGVLALGVVIVAGALVVAGVPARELVPHTLGLVLSAATTGGFAMTSTSVAYYHSVAVELTLLPLMLAGAVSFVVHRTGWLGQRRQVVRELEVRMFLLMLLFTITAVTIGLGRSGAHTDLGALFRQGVFTAVSAQTTSGLAVTHPRLLVTDWGLLAPAALVAAMTVGGMTGSTAGGLKALRVGILLKGLVADVRRVLLPESALVVSTFQRSRRRVLNDGHVRSAATLLLLFLVAALTGAVTILYLDGEVQLTEALFVSTSAAANGGLSVGALATTSPDALKLGLAALMVLGRLEWIAVFSATGFVVTALRGRT